MKTIKSKWIRRMVMGLLPFYLFTLLPFNASAQCGIENFAFKSGEFLSYDLYFNWKFVWVKVGTASMSRRRSVAV